jgi:hypothetical protein
VYPEVSGAFNQLVVSIALYRSLYKPYKALSLPSPVAVLGNLSSP